MAAVAAFVVEQVGLVDLLADAAADFAADGAAEHAAKDGAEQGAEDAADGAADCADGGSRARALQGACHAGHSACNGSGGAAGFLGSVMGVDVVRAALGTLEGHGESAFLKSQRKSAPSRGLGALGAGHGGRGRHRTGCAASREGSRQEHCSDRHHIRNM